MAPNAGSTANSSARQPKPCSSARATVEACLEHDGRSDVPGIKDAGGWTPAGHANRVVEVDEAPLTNFATLYDAAGTPPRRARLPALPAKTLAGVSWRSWR